MRRNSFPLLAEIPRIQSKLHQMSHNSVPLSCHAFMSLRGTGTVECRIEEFRRLLISQLTSCLLPVSSSHSHHVFRPPPAPPPHIDGIDIGRHCAYNRVAHLTPVTTVLVSCFPCHDLQRSLLTQQGCCTSRSTFGAPQGDLHLPSLSCMRSCVPTKPAGALIPALSSLSALVRSTQCSALRGMTQIECAHLSPPHETHSRDVDRDVLRLDGTW
jgi:hypothetical protein